MKTVLLTGFEPYNGHVNNTSQELVEALHGEIIGEYRVVGRVLPVIYAEAIQKLRMEIWGMRPDLVICLGQAEQRKAITPERVAINIMDARIPDEAGHQPIDQPVIPGGPVGYWSTLPIKAIVKTLRDHGLSAEVSQTGGTYVCNAVFYVLMHELQYFRDVRGGFIHVPYLSEENEVPLSFSDLLKGIRLAIQVCEQYDQDLQLAMGSTH